MADKKNKELERLTHASSGVNYRLIIGAHSLTAIDIKILYLLSIQYYPQKIARVIKRSAPMVHKYIRKFKKWGIILGETSTRPKFYDVDEEVIDKINLLIKKVSGGQVSGSTLPRLLIHSATFKARILSRSGKDIPGTKEIARGPNWSALYKKFKLCSIEINRENILINIYERYGGKVDDIIGEMRIIAERKLRDLERYYGWKFSQKVRLTRKQVHRGVINLPGLERFKEQIDISGDPLPRHEFFRIDNSKKIHNPITGKEEKVTEAEFIGTVENYDELQHAEILAHFPWIAKDTNKKLAKIEGFMKDNPRIAEILKYVKDIEMLSRAQAAGNMTVVQREELALSLGHRSMDVTNKVLGVLFPQDQKTTKKPLNHICKKNKNADGRHKKKHFDSKTPKKHRKHKHRRKK